MLKYPIKLTILVCLCFIIVLMIASGQSPYPKVIDLDKGEEDIRILGDDAVDMSGYSVPSGDINGDGYYDVIIGALWADPAGGDKAGETYVIFGSSSSPKIIDLNSVSADMTIYGDDAGDWSGQSVGCGDINGDGYDDVIIGAYFADPAGRTDAGETYVIFGSASPPAIIDLNSESADMTIYGDDAGDASGGAVGSGDINGDGYDDVIIGAGYADPGGRSKAGELYVIFGSSSPPTTIDLDSESADMTVYGDSSNDNLGANASNDINGDGYDDVIIGAGRADPAGGSNAGETYVIFGSSSPPALIDLNSESADMTIYGDDAHDRLGFSTASGDINADGYADVIIGAVHADPGGKYRAGEAYVIFGSASLPATIDLDSESADITIYGDDAGDCCGCSVSSGDVNSDGYDDVIIGATYGDPVARSEAGETYIILGSNSLPATIDLNSVSADMTIYGDDASDYSGHYVASADINGDGCDDIIISATLANPAGRTDAGETYVIFGVPDIIEVEIDIKPGSEPNSINPKSKGRIPVAILTTEDFDATTVDQTTILFGKTGEKASPSHFAFEDVDGDGDADMILHFKTQETGIQCGDTQAILTGKTLDEEAIKGADSIKTVGCKY